MEGRECREGRNAGNSWAEGSGQDGPYKPSLVSYSPAIRQVERDPGKTPAKTNFLSPDVTKINRERAQFFYKNRREKKILDKVEDKFPSRKEEFCQSSDTCIFYFIKYLAWNQMC